MGDAWQVATKYWTQLAQRPVDRAIAEKAAGQHGVVALRQLRELGLSASAVRSRVAAGRLHRLHRGVYSVGHELVSAEGRWMAAVLACGPGAVLAKHSAAALTGIRSTARARIDVIVPGRAGRTRAGIEVHRAGTLDPADVTTVHGIPCTTVGRTLLDLAETIGRHALERACERAESLGIFDLTAIRQLLARSARRNGAPLLTEVVEALRGDEGVARNDLEEAFLAVCAEADLPRPRVNHQIALNGGHVEADFAWPHHRLVAETDGRETHATRRAFQRDRERDRRLLLAGWRVVRFTYGEVLHEQAKIAGTLRALLGAEAPTIAC